MSKLLFFCYFVLFVLEFAVFPKIKLNVYILNPSEAGAELVRRGQLGYLGDRTEFINTYSHLCRATAENQPLQSTSVGSQHEKS